MGGVVKADRLGNFRGAQIAGLNQLDRGVNTAVNQIFVDGHSGMANQQPVEVIGMIAEVFTEGLIGNFLPIVGVDILDDFIDQKFALRGTAGVHHKPGNQ